jgi:FkbM family methyltransferase
MEGNGQFSGLDLSVASVAVSSFRAWENYSMSLESRLRTNSIARSARELITGIGDVSNTSIKSISRYLDKLHIQTVIDVGANVGQFGMDIRRHGFKNQIVSYEPVQETFNTLTRTIKRHQPWKAFRLGLGAEESELSINVSGNAGLSSSIFEMKSLHLENFPESATVSREKISISTVDKQLEILGLLPRDIMLKLDVQGFEAEVLKGASVSLSSIPLCYLEVSISPLYKGEVSFLPLLIELSKFGHEVIDVFRGIKAKDGKLLQLDILTRLSRS